MLMKRKDNLDDNDTKRHGQRAGLVTDFREVWTTVLMGFVGCCAIAGIAGALSFAAFRDGYQSYGFTYLITALFIAFGFPTMLFFMQRRKG